MKLPGSLRPRYAPAWLVMLLPLVLVYSSVRTFRELDRMRSVFLRNRTAAITARLEAMPGGAESMGALAESEPGVLQLRIFSQRGEPALEDLWTGRELFRTEEVAENGVRIFRAHVPFHADGQFRIAQIDLDATSADFLLVHARHNVIIASVSSGVIVLLAAYALWSMRRAAIEEKRRLQTAHLAHLGMMSAVLAHEIRTPLATIKGFTQLALEQVGDSSRPMLEPVVEEVQRLERLVSDLLLYGRPPTPALRNCSWNDIAAALPRTSTAVQVERAPLRLRTDPELLRHVLGNLISNAVEAGSTEVTVRAEVAGAAVVLAVDDDGPGVDAATVHKAFEPFYTTKAFGTGLGLPIARSLTAALGGTLHLRRRPERGTHAEVRLPGAGASLTAEVGA